MINAPSSLGDERAAAPVVDSHAHLWEPARFRYAWLDGEPALDRPFLPVDRAAAAPREHGVIVVEADRSEDQALAEVAWISELAASSADMWIRGVVAHAAVDRGADIAPGLAELAALPLVVGVRRLLQDESPALLSSSLLAQGLQAVGEAGLPFDACVRAQQLPALVRLVAAAPDTTVVLDHLGKPAVTGPPAPSWRDDLQALAAFPQVVVKLSGLATEGEFGSYDPKHVLEHLRHAVEAFGPARCLFGSDWPVSATVVSYAGWLALVEEALSGLSAEETALVLGGNAERVYGLPAGEAVT